MFKLLLYVTALILILTNIAVAQAEEVVAKPPTAMEIETVLCTGVEAREPVDKEKAFPADVGRVYLWTKVTGVVDEEVTIHHVWLKEGEEMADVELPVKGSPWRTYSYKTIPPEWAGNWEVKITGADGDVMKSVAFTVGAKAERTKLEEKPAETPKTEEKPEETPKTDNP
jgi:hypothetical protein